MSTNDGDINYSRYTVAELREALAGIRRDAYPKNYANILSALAALNEPVDLIAREPPSNFEAAETDLLASRGSRLGAVLLDALIGLAVAYPITYSLGYWQLAMTAADKQERIPPGMMLQWRASALLLFLLVQGYPLIRDGQTWGKKALSIKIVDLSGRKPSISQLCVRYAIIMVAPAIPFLGRLIGLVDVLLIFRSDKRCGHDLAAGTRVIREIESG
jgi:uncharacterized RDD family membrane protein YckC